MTNKGVSVYSSDHQLYGGVKTADAELHWSAYKSASNSPFGGSSPKFGHHQRPSTSSLPGDTCLNVHSPHSPPSPPYPTESTPASPFTYMSPVEQRRRYTPPPTPPLVKPSSKGKFPTTPPPQKKNKLCPDSFQPLTKSKSHESQLSMKVSQDVDLSRLAFVYFLVYLFVYFLITVICFLITEFCLLIYLCIYLFICLRA